MTSHFGWSSGTVSKLMLWPVMMATPLDATPLDDYVKQPDPNYGYRLIRRLDGDGGTVYLLNMASQAWRTGKDVDRILWRHWLEIYVPDTVEHQTALLLVGGGDNGYEPPNEPNRMLARTALASRAVTAHLRNVPNQPLIFMADPDLESRREDEILAFAWSRYTEDGDATWMPLLPMVKSVVRAMDTITTFCAELDGHTVDVSQFVVSGYSKRGWTSWLTAAVDERVVGVAPTVIDMLNTKRSFQHQFRAYGKYAEAVQDYVDNGVMDAMDKPEIEQALAVVDPFAYRERYTMPKLILNSTGDQFFMPDSWQFYWHDLPEPKYLRYIPNTDHGLDDSADETLQSFYGSVLTSRALPRFRWTVEAPGRIRLETEQTPISVLKWQATNPQARDFRLQTIGAAWKSEELTDQGGGVYIAEQQAPEQGWTAFLVELSFRDPIRDGATLKLTTGVSVTPDTLPFTLENK